MAWTVTDTGTASVRRLTSGFEALDGSSVSWGWTEDSADYPNGDDVVERAAIHHFGTDDIPSRPILVETFERNVGQIQVLAEALNQQVIDNQVNDIAPALQVIGQFAQSNMQQDFTRVQLEPLAQSTVNSKGHDLPLVETGHMRAQVRFKVNLT